MLTKGKVKGIISNLVIVEADGPVAQNEICFITTGSTRLMAEVIKVIGNDAYVQVFESTRGLKVGNKAEFQGQQYRGRAGLSCSERKPCGFEFLKLRED